MSALVAVLLAAMDGGVSSVSFSPSEVYARVSDSVFLVKVDDGAGSAVVVGPELLVTNYHVIDGTTSVRVSFGDTSWEASVERTNPARDLALLRAPGLHRSVPRRRQLRTLRVGERVYALGAPQGLEQTFSEGIVSALRPGAKDVRPLQHTAPIAQGSSGGGLFDDRGRLVGINTSLRPIRTARGADIGGDLNFAVPADWIDDLLAGKGGVADAGVVPGTTRHAAFNALRRPRAVDCHLIRRQRYAPSLSGELTEMIGEEPLDSHLFVINFASELAEARDDSPFDREGRDIVLSAIDASAGIVQFTGTRFGPNLTFVFSDDGFILVLFFQATQLRGQPRHLVTVGECEAIDFDRQKADREAKIRSQEAAFRALQASLRSSQEACDSGDPAACLVVAKDAIKDGSDGLAALSFKKACMAGSKEGCDSALHMYKMVGNSKAVAEVQQRLCRLVGCTPDQK